MHCPVSSSSDHHVKPAFRRLTRCYGRLTRLTCCVTGRFQSRLLQPFENAGQLSYKHLSPCGGIVNQSRAPVHTGSPLLSFRWTVCLISRPPHTMVKDKTSPA